MGLEVELPNGQVVGSTSEAPEDPWWDGREVAIRPDVPSREFDPEDLVLVKTDDERVEVQKRIIQHVVQKLDVSDKDLWPTWLCEPPTRASD
jgi:hypothetical protein